MKLKYALIIMIFAFSLIIFGCTTSVNENPKAKASKEFVKTFNLAVESVYMGDSEKLINYMENDKNGKVLKNLLIEDGIDINTSAPKYWAGFILPAFSKSYFSDGDILLNRDYGSFASNLLDWLIPSLYTHTGVLDKARYELNQDADTPCIMSATLSEDVSGLTLQTWRDWATASTVTRMRLDYSYLTGNFSGFEVNFQTGKDNFDYFYNDGDNNTDYGFIYWDGEQLRWVPNLPGSDVGDETWSTKLWASAHYWHCSKTAWFIYYSMGFTGGVYGNGPVPDIENNDWYLPPHTTETRLKTFGFYKLYKAFLELQGESTVGENGEDIVLNDLEDAIKYVAIPDEIRFATINKPDGTEGGPLNPYNIKTWGLPEWLLGN